MSTALLNLNLDTPAFIDEFWQKKPHVIRQGFSQFDDPVDEHDLAGLAQEDSVDSRLVSYHNNNWTVTQGPLAAFDTLCKGRWSLMVQGVDKWVPEVQILAQQFRFIPHWRFDDVMVSFAVPGAGVGPHVDQYDVFLIQGKGKRHWQVGAPSDVKDRTTNDALQQVAPFKPIIDVELNPGDILYIPPGYPHCGTSIEDSLTYSIGFRAPTASDLLQPITDTLFNAKALPRYTDGELEQRHSAKQVTVNELKSISELVTQAFNQDDWYKALMCHLSEQSLPIEPASPEFTEGEIAEAINHGAKFETTLGVTPLTSPLFDDQLFIQGEALFIQNEGRNWLLNCLSEAIPHTIPKELQSNLDLTEVVTILVNKGILFLVD